MRCAAPEPTVSGNFDRCITVPAGRRTARLVRKAFAQLGAAPPFNSQHKFVSGLILPRLLDVTMRNRRLARYREQTIGLARGLVLEIGVGSDGTSRPDAAIISPNPCRAHRIILLAKVGQQCADVTA